MESKKSTVISLRLKPDVARAFKIEAARRGIKLNSFFEELFSAYKSKAVPKAGRAHG